MYVCTSTDIQTSVRRLVRSVVIIIITFFGDYYQISAKNWLFLKTNFTIILFNDNIGPSYVYVM
jgi:hypothetical protein